MRHCSAIQQESWMSGIGGGGLKDQPPRRPAFAVSSAPAVFATPPRKRELMILLFISYEELFIRWF